MRTKIHVTVLAAFFLTTLWGCGSNMDSGGDQSGPGTTVEDAAKVGTASCKVCHTAIVNEGWASSAHDVSTAGCEGCHGGGQFHYGTGPLPYPAPTLTQCAACHDVGKHLGDDPATSYGTTPSNPVIEGYVVTNCEDCHYPKNFDPAVTTEWPHNPDATINADWALSGHAGKIAAATPDTGTVWGHYDWDAVSRQSCQRCHTATGIKNYLTAPATYNSKKNDFSHLSGWVGTVDGTGQVTAATVSGQNELLYCWGCHSDVQTGALRNPGAITESYAKVNQAASTTNTVADVGTAVTVSYPDVGASNVCMACHLGREVGANIATVTSASDGILSFVNSHYLTAGATIFNESGYEFTGQTYNAFGFHKKVGTVAAPGTGTDGPCVSCHMQSAKPHTFSVVATDSNGAITAVTGTVCATCHATITPATLEQEKEEFHLALEELKVALDAKGIYFAPSNPYFFTAPWVDYTPPAANPNVSFTNWAGVATAIATANPTAAPVDWRNVIGAAFNYNMLEHDPGAYAHNRDYALKLIADSLDFLNDGLVDGDTSKAAQLLAQGMNVGSSAGYAAVHTASLSTASALVCSGCHTASPHYGGVALKSAQFVAPVTSFDANGGQCSDCHGGNTATDIAANAEIIAQFAESGHGDGGGDPWYHYDWRSSSRASCARCHNATAYVAKLGNESNTALIFNGTTDSNLAGEVLSCVACHTDVSTGAVRTPGVYTETYTDGAVYTFPDIGKSNLCIRCHSGREAGSTIAADTDADGDRSFINSHYLTAGGTVFTTTGYEYAGKSYANPVYYAHDKVGIAVPGSPAPSDAGPCAGCHMGITANHSWDVVEKDAEGAIVAINSDICATCHSGAYVLTAAELETEVHHYHAALAALESALAAKGIYFQARNPYFFVSASATAASFTDWDGVAVNLGLAAVPGYKDVMGAAFNYNLLHHDPGGYAHNRFYAKRLIFDSIDLIDNGVLNGTISVTGDAATYLDGDSGTVGIQRP